MEFSEYEIAQIKSLLLSEDERNKLLACELIEASPENIPLLKRALCTAAYLDQNFRDEVEGKIHTLLQSNMHPLEFYKLQNEIIILDYARYKFKVQEGWHTTNNPLRKFLKAHEEVIHHYLEIFKLNPTRFAQYYWVLAKRIQEEMQNHRIALQFFERALFLVPNFKSARMSYAMILHQFFLKKGKRLDEYPKVLDYYISSFYTKDQMAPYINAALLALEMDDLKKSIEIYKEGLHINPEDTILLNNYANLLYKELGDYAQAKSLCEKGLGIAPTDAFLLDTLANIEMLGYQNYEKAEALFLKALRSDGKHHHSHTGLGDLYVLMKRYPLAEAHYKKGLYADMQFTSKERKEVIEKLEKMVEFYTHHQQDAARADFYLSKLHRLQK